MKAWVGKGKLLKELRWERGPEKEWEFGEEMEGLLEKAELSLGRVQDQREANFPPVAFSHQHTPICAPAWVLALFSHLLTCQTAPSSPPRAAAFSAPMGDRDLLCVAEAAGQRHSSSPLFSLGNKTKCWPMGYKPSEMKMSFMRRAYPTPTPISFLPMGMQITW